MITTAKQISQDKAGREVLYFDVLEKTGIVSVIGADTVLGANMVKHLIDGGKRSMVLRRKKTSNSR